MTHQGSRRVVLRADGGSTLGLGHVIRALALAEMLASDSEVTFYTRAGIDSANRTIAQKTQLVVLDDALPIGDEAEVFAKRLSGEETVVLDGNHFDRAYQAAVKRRGCHVICVDDLCDRRFVADLIINHAGAVKPDDYRYDSGTQFCLGPRFALLRPPFLAMARKRRARVSSANVLVCLGGADPKNDLLTVLAVASARLPDSHFQIVVGAGYRFVASLEEFLKCRSLASTVHRGISSEQMAEVMTQCPSAITTPSTTSYEYASVGGFLYLYQIVDDQTFIRRGLVDGGMAFDLEGPRPDHAALERSLERQRAVFDGRSDQRLREAIGAFVHV